MENDYTLSDWLYAFVAKAQQVYHSRLWGGNAYLYKRNSGYMCCALLYSKPKKDWVEVAARHHFSNEQIPLAILNVYAKEQNCIDISDLLYSVIQNFNANGGNEMKFNLFKLAQVAQTAMNVADNVNATYNVHHDEDDALSSYAQDTSMTGSERGMSMVRAALNQDWFDLAKLGFDALVNLVSKDPLSFDDYLAAISQYIDVKIQQFSHEEQLRFVGGECALTVVKEEQVVKTKAQMYFKNTAGKWIVKEMHGNTTFNCFTAATLDAEITDIMLEGGKKFPITAPER